MRVRGVVVAASVMLGGCAGETAVAPLNNAPVTFLATNNLIAPITIAVAGSPYAILATHRSTQLTLPANTRLTWTSAKPADANGEMIPDQVGEVTVDVSALNGALEITNVIENQTYFTARIFNFTALRVSIGVFEGPKVWCASVLPAATDRPGFTLIGYYQLLPATELRAYTSSINCTGSYVAWSSSQLTGFEAKSGLLTLSLEPAT